jgi:uncharacterized metal-binding protein YceD (DUF177 family)
MNYLDKYRISFGSLAKGEHEFEFEIDDKFFEQFGNEPVQHGFLDVLVTVNKQETMLLIDFTMEGSVETVCARCGDPLELELTGFNELTVKFGPEPGEESEDVIVISPKEHEINVAQFIYEYVTLLIPMRNVHEEDETGESACNPETLLKLDQLRHHEEEEKESDPRWDVLKKINLN